MAGQEGADTSLVAHKDDLMPKLAGCLNCALYDHSGGMIASHSVKYDAHT